MSPARCVAPVVSFSRPIPSVHLPSSQPPQRLQELRRLQGAARRLTDGFMLLSAHPFLRVVQQRAGPRAQASEARCVWGGEMGLAGALAVSFGSDADDDDDDDNDDDEACADNIQGELLRALRDSGSSTSCLGVSASQLGGNAGPTDNSCVMDVVVEQGALDGVQGEALDVEQRAADVEDQAIRLVRARLFEAAELALDHAVLHVMTLASLDALQQQLLAGAQVDKMHADSMVIVRGNANDVAVFLLQGGASEHYAGRALLQLGEGLVAQRDQPVPAVGVGERGAGSHLLDVGRRVVLGEVAAVSVEKAVA